MTPAEHALIVAACTRSAELWAEGDEQGAGHWFEAAKRMLAGRTFVDMEANR